MTAMLLDARHGKRCHSIVHLEPPCCTSRPTTKEWITTYVSACRETRWGVRSRGKHVIFYLTAHNHGCRRMMSLPHLSGCTITTKVASTMGNTANTPEANEPIQWLAVVTTATTSAAAAARSGRS